jgi:hypothetical protein
VESKSERVKNYITTLRHDLLKVSEAAGVGHPALIDPDLVEVLDTLTDGQTLGAIYDYKPGWALPSEQDRQALADLMAERREPRHRLEGPPEVA